MDGAPWRILQGDVRAVMKTLPADHFHAALGDPPYGIRFMGNRWDYDVPSVNVWTELLRIIRPGAPVLMFGGSKTFHRVAVYMEDAGLRMMETLLWLYGTGMPHGLDIAEKIDQKLGAERKVVGTKKGKAIPSYYSRDIGKAREGGPPEDVIVTTAGSDLAKLWEGHGTQLKPGFEPCLYMAKPLDGTYAENALKWGTGGIAIDAARIGEWGYPKATHEKKPSRHCYGDGLNGGGSIPTPGGRWPSNILLDESAAAELDARVGERPSTLAGRADPKKRHTNPGHTNGSSWYGGKDSAVYADTGGPSRYFYTTKADATERHAGLNGEENDHPTVKPIDLIRYLARLILPPRTTGPRRILVPYSGSGSEMIACMQAGWDEVIGIEREAKFIAIAERRIRKGGVFSTLHREKRR